MPPPICRGPHLGRKPFRKIARVLPIDGSAEHPLDDETANSDGLHNHMAVYSRVAPKVNASKKAGEWQAMEAVIVGNRVTVKLNGQVVHDNLVIDGITGGALDAREGEPGPIMIQGDHEKVYFRKVVVTPIVK